MHFNDTASSDNPTPTLPCAQGRGHVFEVRCEAFDY
jgi:hypothetical protein